MTLDTVALVLRGSMVRTNNRLNDRVFKGNTNLTLTEWGLS